MGLSPLAVAGIASALLVIVIGADVSMNRTYFLEAHDGTEWHLLAESPWRHERGYARPYPTSPVIEANASDPLSFRLRVENTYRWGYSDEYVVYTQGREALRGSVDVPATSERAFEFNLNASRVLGRTGPVATPLAKDATTGIIMGSLEVEIGKQFLYGNLQIKEVPR